MQFEARSSGDCYQLSAAVLAYTNVATRQAFATRHPVEMQDGQPTIRPGTALTEHDYQQLLQALAPREQPRMAWCDPRVLARGLDRILWWSPPMRRSLFFRKSAHNPQTFDGQGPCPYPGLVFLANGTRAVRLRVQGPGGFDRNHAPVAGTVFQRLGPAARFAPAMQPCHWSIAMTPMPGNACSSARTYSPELQPGRPADRRRPTGAVLEGAARPGWRTVSRAAYLQGLVVQAQVAILRAGILLFWLAAVAPLLAAGICDGLMQRKVKQAEFGSLRPATFTLASMVVVLMLAAPVLYLTFPASLSSLLVPSWAALLVLPLSVLVANSQPLSGN